MSTVAPAVEPVGPARTSGLAAIFEHTRYVLGENRVTAFAFGLLVVIVFAALFGPYVVPYDPLASDTAAAINWAAIFLAASSSQRGSIPSSLSRRWCWCF
jgi:peptide/nickel transport system permease protein